MKLVLLDVRLGSVEVCRYPTDCQYYYSGARLDEIVLTQERIDPIGKGVVHAGGWNVRPGLVAFSVFACADWSWGEKESEGNERGEEEQCERQDGEDRSTGLGLGFWAAKFVCRATRTRNLVSVRRMVGESEKLET